ncbi:MAG: hypothetical protein WC205_16950 [Opitutaceae bacterium]|jgi:hypothetical protein
MAIDRSTIPTGPGKVLFDSAHIFSQDGINATISKETFEVLVDAYGVVDQRLKDISVQVTLTPKMWKDLAVILPYAAMNVGTSIFGAVDKPLVITPNNGQPLTIAAAAVTKLPSITLSTNKPILGSMEFSGMLANATEWAAAASRVSLGVAASDVALTGFDLTKVPNYAYSAAIGTLAFETEDGFQIDFSLSLDDQPTDSQGNIDKTLGTLTATCRCVPIGITQDEILTALAIQGTGVRRGASIGGADLVITGSEIGAPVVTLHGASLSQGGSIFQRGKKRAGEITFVTRRTVTTGVLGPLFEIGEVPDPEA